MRHNGSAVLIVVLTVVLFCQLVSAGEESQAERLAGDNTVFAINLYRQLSEAKGNLFLSPYSISSAMAMTYAGARGETAKQMAAALCFSLDQNALHPAFADLQARIDAANKSGEVTLNVANSLWPQAGYDLLKEYPDLMKKYYRVSITPLDYINQASEARVTINRWVKEETRGKIEDIIQPGVLDAMTRLVIVNAVYFKGNWASRFDSTRTQTAPFYVSHGDSLRADSVLVPMMTMSRRFMYADFDSLQAIRMPYAGDSLSMVILLPREPFGLLQLEASLSSDNLRMWRQHLRYEKVEVFVPKFKMSSTFGLNKALISMGMGDAFMSEADFSGIAGLPHDLWIAAVLHKAYVDVNEAGTEAAAATAVVVELSSFEIDEPLPVFRADHPFLFLIQHNSTGSVLFMGRVADPTKPS